jgi:hypothetical protein
MRPHVLAAALVLAIAPAARAQMPAKTCNAMFEEAQVEQKRMRLSRARDLYDVCARAPCSAILAEDCARRRNVIEESLPTIAFVLRDQAGRDVPAEILVDGALFPSTGRAKPMDPGPHTVVYSVSSRVVQLEIVVQQGEKNRLVYLDLPDGKSGPSSPGASSLVVVPPAPRASPVPYILLTVGIVAAISGIACVIHADDVQKSAPLMESPGNVTLRGVGLAATVSGSALVASGITWLILDRTSSPVAIAPLAGPHVAGAAFTGRF